VDWSNLKTDYERLGSYTAVAREYGVSKGYVAQQAKKQGINPKPEGRSLPIDWSELPALYDSGMTYEQLTAHYGCSVHAIQNAMKRMNVASRPRGLPEGYEWTDERRAAHRAAIDRPEWRAKMRENLLARLPLMRGPSANSPLEKLLQAALIKTGISFSTQRVLLSRYCVDILLHQAPVVLEADGSLHHLRKEQDAERDAALIKAGYRVFRFAGSVINTDAMGCVSEVIAACGLTPDTEPVADIRTGMMGSDNPNWNGGFQIFACESCGTEIVKDAFNARVMKRKFCNSECYGAWMRKHPEESNRRLKTDWSELPSLYAGGMTMMDLAQHFGCSRNTIIRTMRRMDVTARKPGRISAPPQ
jgi:very-short-patch-repair endonuclease/Mor family transcriptional regulator